MFKRLLYFFIAELITIPLVGLIFSKTPDRFTAGMIAGSLFIAIGVWIVMTGVRDRAFRRMWTFYFGCLHLFGIALPMVITRILNASSTFEDTLIWGLPGPVFHKLSTYVFGGLILATLIEMILVKLRERKTTRVS